MKQLKPGEPIAHSTQIGRLDTVKRQSRFTDLDSHLKDRKGYIPLDLLPKGDQLFGKEIMLLLPGFELSEASAVAIRWHSAITGQRLTATHDGRRLDNSLSEIEQMLDCVVADSNWVLQNPYVQNIPHAVEWKRLDGDRYELQAYSSGVSTTAEKAALVRKAKLTGRVLRFTYLDRFGVPRTRRVAVRKFSNSELMQPIVRALDLNPRKHERYFSATIREFGHRSSSVRGYRRFTLAKASNMVLENTPARTLQPEWNVRVRFTESSYHISVVSSA